LDAEKYPALSELKRKLLPDFSFLKNRVSGTEVLTFNLGLEGVFSTDVVLDFSDERLDYLRIFCFNLSRLAFALFFAWLIILALRQW